MAERKQKYLTKGTNEYLAGIEWDATKQLTISGGYQKLIMDCLTTFKLILVFIVTLTL